MTFVARFQEDTELTGYMKLRLWVEADGSDDMDLFVNVNKLDEQGNPLYAKVLDRPWSGAQGLLRVSRRELDAKRSTPSEPYLTHRREQLLKPGDIVPVEIGIWPVGMLWHRGQQLQLTIQGHPISDQDSDPPSRLKYLLRNKGNHIIHAGGKYDSHLLIPRIPAAVSSR